MAARRLLAVLLVLLVISTIVAVLAPGPDPPPPERTPRKAEQAPSPGAEEKGTGGQLIEARVAAAPRSKKGRGPADRRSERRVIRASPGDRLRLEVFGTSADVEIPALGLTETMTPYAPAFFDIFLDRTGSFAVRISGSGRALARIDSTRPRAGASPTARTAQGQTGRGG